MLREEIIEMLDIFDSFGITEVNQRNVNFMELILILLGEILILIIGIESLVHFSLLIF